MNQISKQISIVGEAGKLFFYDFAYSLVTENVFTPACHRWGEPASFSTRGKKIKERKV